MNNPSSIPFLADVIASGESKGAYTIYNKGKGHRYKIGHTSFSTMTINDVMKRQALPSKHPDRLFAVGKYQIIPNTLKSAMKSLSSLTGQELFNEQIQDFIFTDYLLKIKRPHVYKSIINTSLSFNRALLEIAQEWASVGVASKGERSYYSGDGINKAHTPSKEVLNALKQARNIYHEKVYIEKSVPSDDAFRFSVTGKTF